MTSKELAEQTVKQWDEHDKFRDFEKQGPPTEVKLARAYLRMEKMHSEQIDYSIMLQRFLAALANDRPLPNAGHDTFMRKVAVQIQERIRNLLV